MQLDIFNDKINLIYDYLYNEPYRINYKIEEINLNNINESDIDIPIGDLSDEILKQILTQNLQLLFIIDNCIYFKVLAGNISTILKISFDKKTSFNDGLTSYILSELVLKFKTTNILLPIININVKLSSIEELLKKVNNLPESIETLLNDDPLSTIVSLQLKEGFYNLQTTRDYIKNNILNYKSFLFRIFILYNILINKYNYFSHGALNLDNIFLYINNNFEDEIVRINEQAFRLINEKFQIKLTNFGYSSITKNKVKIIDIIDDNDEFYNNIKKEHDIKTLVKDILKENKNIDIETNNFLVKLRDMSDYDYNVLINDQFFDEYKLDKKAYHNKQHGYRNKQPQFKLLNENTDFGKQPKLIRKLKHIKGGNPPKIEGTMRAEKNNPFKTNDQKTTSTKKQIDEPINRQPILLEQTIYDTSKPSSSKQQMPPAQVPIYTDNYGMPLPYNNILNPVYKEPIQKVYNISLANPLHDFTTMSRVYEDVLPGDPKSFTFTTLYERTQLIHFMRNLINTHTDGELMNITGGHNTLLSSIKLDKINPYSLNLTQPYLDLGKNFLIYNAVYPIRYDSDKNTVFASKTAHGINVRIYNIAFGENIADNINYNITNFNFDIWRELYYYKFVHDVILTKKISPNFISSILYKKDNLSKVNWTKLTELQKKNNSDIERIIQDNLNRSTLNLLDNSVKFIVYVLTNNSQVFSDYDKLKYVLKSFDNIKIIELNILDPPAISLINKNNINKFPTILFEVNKNVHTIYDGILNTKSILEYINNNITNIGYLIDLFINSGDSLILLTEAPHTNIIRWATPVRTAKGSLYTMTSTGFHHTDVWYSILFQIMHIFYILQEYDILFDELSLVNNFYIKDLYYEPTNKHYWIYNVDGINYYVPNYGYLVLFDSKYTDTLNNDYKIKSTKLFPNKNNRLIDTPDIGPNIYSNDIFYKFKNVFDPSVFTVLLKSLGGLIPDSTILTFINNINIDVFSENKINLFIHKYFTMYLNERVGRSLLRSEKENINELSRPDFNIKGEILVKQERYDLFKWVIYKDNHPTSDILKQIITKNDDGTINTELVNTYALFKYPFDDFIKITNIDENKIIDRFRL